MNPGCRVRDQLNTSEPTAPYIIERELNLRKLPGRQWESCPQPYEQLRLKRIKTSASTKSATTAYTNITSSSVSSTLKPLSLSRKRFLSGLKTLLISLSFPP